MNGTTKQAVWQVPALLLAAGLLALVINQWRADRLELVGDWSVGRRFADAAETSLILPFEEAQRIYRDGTAIFLDARPADQFAEGHIRGALNFPVMELDRYYMQLSDRLERAEAIIAYCDGESCDLSHELALFLQDMGFNNVHVLVDGWDMWQQAGLPVQTGE